MAPTIIIQPRQGSNNNKPPAAAQAKPAQAKPSQKPKKHEDFSHEYMNLPVVIKLASGDVINAVVIDGSRYWLKVRAADGKVMYINKAYVVSVSPQTEGKDAVKR